MDKKYLLPFQLEPYFVANSVWPANGKYILASCRNGNVIVYQAYNPTIAEWATAHQSFKGCPGYSVERMTWIKPNFLWMMYRSGWAEKVNQERILALEVTKDGFEKLLQLCRKRAGDKDEELNKEFGSDDVRLQWDPDHDPYGDKVERRAIQLGIRGAALKKFIEEWIVSITDITGFVKSQYEFVKRKELDLLQVPVQRVYEIENEEIRTNIGIDT